MDYDLISVPSSNVTPGVTIIPKLIIAHCIGLPIDDVIEGFTRPAPEGLGVSSHYFIPQISANACVTQFLARGYIPELPPLAFPDKVPVIQFVDESKRALHAGASHWGTYNNLPGCASGLNSCSIGIEFHAPGYGADGDFFTFSPYTQDQMETGALLMRDIVDRWSLDPKSILAHSDIAPYFPQEGASPRIKTDPGPLFPWCNLDEKGLGYMPPPYSAEGQNLKGQDAEMFVRNRLRDIGYHIPVDPKTMLPWGELEKHIVNAYKMHYMQDSYVPCNPTSHEFGKIDDDLMQSLLSMQPNHQ